MEPTQWLRQREMLPQTNWIRFYYFCDFSVCFLAAGICLPGTGSINKLFTLRGGFIPATVSHLPSLLLPLSLSFSLARANNCHGNHQRCQTTNKRKPLNAHLSQKEQNCSLITMGTIKTVHIYWRGTSHSSICSWIAGESRRRGTGRGVALEMELQIVLSQLHFNQIKPLKAGYDLPFCTRKPTRPNSIGSNNQTFTPPPSLVLSVLPPSPPVGRERSGFHSQEQEISIWALLGILITRVSPPVIRALL